MTGPRRLPLCFAAAGQGDQGRAAGRAAPDLGLGDRFRFLGHRRDALALLTAADIVVLPSHQEGLPVVLMEATSVGATIVATSVGGVPQVITDGVNGLLVPPGRSRRPGRRPRAPGPRPRPPPTDWARRRRPSSATFDVARASREIEEIYRELLDDPGRAAAPGRARSAG